MRRRTRPHQRLRITIDLTGPELERVRDIAERQGTTIEDTIRQAIDLAMQRGTAQPRESEQSFDRFGQQPFTRGRRAGCDRRFGYDVVMDLGSMVVTVLGALGTGSWIGQYLSQRSARKLRLEEKSMDRDERHRDDLRHAYAEFVATYTRFLDAGALLHSVNVAIHDLPIETYEHALAGGADEGNANQAAANSVPPELRLRGQRALDDFATAATASDTAASAVLIIDDDPVRRGMMQALADATILPPQEYDDFDRFLADLKKLRAELSVLTRALGGTFSPDRFHAELKARRTLVSTQAVHSEALNSGAQQAALTSGDT